MNETLDLTITEVAAWIDEYVPKRTGRLRESLRHFLSRSKPPPMAANELRNVYLVLGVGEEAIYAKYLANMTDAQVQHINTWFEHSGRRAYANGKRILLHDPNARAKFFDMLIIYARERFRVNLEKIEWVNMK